MRRDVEIGAGGAGASARQHGSSGSWNESSALDIFRAQESGGNIKARAVASGGRVQLGSLQLGQALFKEHARAGESFDRQADVERVAERAFKAIFRKHGGDISKTAVEWFSGAQNVASGNRPWKRNKSDGHKDVATYVSDIMRRASQRTA